LITGIHPLLSKEEKRMEQTILTKNGTRVVNLSRKKGIRERCLNCSCWSFKEVDECQFIDCSLYPFRSGKGKQVAKDRSKAMKEYCTWCMSGQVREVGKCVSTDCSLFNFRSGRKQGIATTI
jgi:hypothetical protein